MCVCVCEGVGGWGGEKGLLQGHPVFCASGGKDPNIQIFHKAELLLMLLLL